jgi:hypothetical protein
MVAVAFVAFCCWPNASKFVNPEIDAAIASKKEIARMADICLFYSLLREI